MLTYTMGDFFYAEKANMHCIFRRANGSGTSALLNHHAQFLIDECCITEIFSFYHRIFRIYIIDLVKQIRSTSADMKLVCEELYDEECNVL